MANENTDAAEQRLRRIRREQAEMADLPEETIADADASVNPTGLESVEEAEADDPTQS